MSRALRILKMWLPIAVAISGLCALAFGSVQQVLRQGANDPQIAMAEDAATALDQGAKAANLIGSERVELARSLTPFLLFYDAEGNPVAGSGLLAGHLPDYPLGALQAARTSGENRVTWQPQPDVRIASVVVPYNDGYVVAGRSLREVEKRVVQMQAMAFLAWFGTMLASLVFAAAVDLLPAK